MSAVVTIDFAIQWDKPVYVGRGDRLDMTIVGPGDAIRYMRTEFRAKHGPAYWHAQNLCLHALLGQTDPRAARQAFVDAWMDQVSTDFADER
ncbi:DUF982 domain-containing protein [Rhizobium sp. NFR07]|uniref:DUF982 domain-containing protein n=1 Tax=Rhizobium sp. NFR07 TaxID=1566262 RepID=UPI000B81F350|nr:DUF982 domain-containing protein [Rhizobium sp. NFR07]